jgi:peptidoglycan/LPS O-acetylase OafA/YrhL
MRTLPLYFVCLVLISILTGQLFELDFLKYLFLVQKTFPNFVVNDYFPVGWSLSIEEFFYIVFPLILVSLNKHSFINKVVYIFIFLALSKFFIASYVDPNFYRTGTLLRFDAILLGFIISHYQVFLLKNKKTILLLFIILTPFYIFNFNFFIEGNKIVYVKFLFILFMQLLSSVTMLSFISLESIILNNNFKKFSLFISQQAYSIYLFHMIFIYILKILNYSVLISSGLYIMLLFFTSTLVYKYFEEPIIKMRPKIL